MENQILTLEEVAEILRVSERTVTEWANKGELPGGKLGTSWRFKKSEIDQWLSRKLSPRVSPAIDETRPLSALLSPKRTLLLHTVSKGDALNALIDSFNGVEGIRSRDALAEGIFSREALMSTGVGLGMAFPHVRLDGVKDIFMALGVNDNDLTDYESLDGTPVRIIVMIVAGRDQHSKYIKMLAKMSQLFKTDSIRQRVLAAKTSQELYSVVTSKEDTL